VLRSRDVEEIEELRRQRATISGISALTGWDRKTVRKYLRRGAEAPCYDPPPARPSKLDPHKDYLEERLQAGVWNARVLFAELRQGAPRAAIRF